MTPYEFGILVREKIEERINQGWVISRLITRGTFVAGPYDGREYACGIGCWLDVPPAFDDSRVPLLHAGALAGLTSSQTTSFAGGFDGFGKTDRTLNEWHALGAQIAEELKARGVLRG